MILLCKRGDCVNCRKSACMIMDVEFNSSKGIKDPETGECGFYRKREVKWWDGVKEKPSAPTEDKRK